MKVLKDNKNLLISKMKCKINNKKKIIQKIIAKNKKLMILI